ncbi:MAG: hypothetical protein KatS3mg102_1725 [Planctomycetota bacterium]|nr:MAG: hypothetical protein KatS3mg102_1725 [Planctomycetota bacterium]
MEPGLLQLVERDLVFVVDDEPVIREVLMRQLKRQGWRVEAFEAAEPALARMDKALPALVVSDLKMPGMSGVELLRAVRQRASGEIPAFVIVTAYGELDSAREALRYGAMDYVAKPFDLPELTRRLRNAMRLVELALGRATLRHMLAEDLRTPLGALHRNLEALEQGLAGALTPPQRELVALARREGARLHRLVENLDDLELLERDELYHRPEPVPLAEVLRQAVARLQAADGPAERGPAAPGAVPVRVAPGLEAAVLAADRALAVRLCECLLRAGANAAAAGSAAQAPPVLAVERSEAGGVQLELGPLPGMPGGSATLERALLDPAARRALRAAGVALNDELELSFARAAAAALGGTLRLQASPEACRVVIALPSRQAAAISGAAGA